jgi:hypothetical protein
VEKHICDIFLKKYSNVKFNENPSRGSLVVPCRQTARASQTHRHEEANCYFLLCHFVNAPREQKLGK